MELSFGLLARERDGNDVSRRLENMDVILGKRSACPGMDAHNPIRPVRRPDEHADTADYTMLMQKRWTLETRFFSQIVHDHRLTLHQGKTCLGSRSTFHYSLPDQARLPANPGA